MSATGGSCETRARNCVDLSSKELERQRCKHFKKSKPEIEAAIAKVGNNAFQVDGKNLITQFLFPFNGTQDVVRYLSGMKPTKLFKKTPNKERRPAVKKKAADIRAEYQEVRERLVFGSLGAASPVRRIDPKTGDVLALIDPKSGAIQPTKTRKR